MIELSLNLLIGVGTGDNAADTATQSWLRRCDCNKSISQKDDGCCCCCYCCFCCPFSCPLYNPKNESQHHPPYCSTTSSTCTKHSSISIHTTTAARIQKLSKTRMRCCRHHKVVLGTITVTKRRPPDTISCVVVVPSPSIDGTRTSRRPILILGCCQEFINFSNDFPITVVFFVEQRNNKKTHFIILLFTILLRRLSCNTMTTTMPAVTAVVAPVAPVPPKSTRLGTLNSPMPPASPSSLFLSKSNNRGRSWRRRNKTNITIIAEEKKSGQQQEQHQQVEEEEEEDLEEENIQQILEKARSDDISMLRRRSSSITSHENIRTNNDSSSSSSISSASRIQKRSGYGTGDGYHPKDAVAKTDNTTDTNYYYNDVRTTRRSRNSRSSNNTDGSLGIVMLDDIPVATDNINNLLEQNNNAVYVLFWIFVGIYIAYTASSSSSSSSSSLKNKQKIQKLNDQHQHQHHHDQSCRPPCNECMIL